MFRRRQNDDSVIGGVFIAFFILLFHVALLALIGVLVLFLSGLLNYLPWILLGGLLLLIGSGYLLVRRVVRKSGDIIRFLDVPELRGKNIELKVLGGLASVKINDSKQRELLPGSDEELASGGDHERRQQRLVQ